MNRDSTNFLNCGLCNNVMMQPKLLSGCYHTFCSACLKVYCDDKTPGSKVMCPLKFCKSVFTLPKGGIDDIPDNIFAKKLGDIASKNYTAQYVFCDVHISEHIRAYCMDCKKAVCYTCFIIKHGGHKCCELAEVELSLSNDLRQNILKTEEFSISIEENLLKVNSDIKEIDNEISNIENMITTKVKERKKELDDQEAELMSKLKSYKESALEKFVIHKTKLENRKSEIEALLKESEQALNKKYPEFFNSFSLLNSKHSNIEVSKFALPKIDHQISFVLCNLELQNNIGQLEYKDMKKDILPPVPIKLSEAHQKFDSEGVGFQVCVVYSGNLFCASNLSSEIWMFKQNSCKVVGKFKIVGLERPTSMAATCNCLFLTNSRELRIDIMCIDLSSFKCSRKWSVKGQYGKLSLTSHDNILICTSDPNQLLEYTLEGKMVEGIKLNKSISDPQHAVKIGSNFIICSKGSDDVLFLMDCNGIILKTFSSLTDTPKFSSPCHILVDINSNIFVFDSTNSRIMVIRDDFKLLKEITFDDEIFCNKTCGFLDGTMLYLSNTIDSNIHVFDIGHAFA